MKSADPITRMNTARFGIKRELRSISWVAIATLAATSLSAQEPPLRPVFDLLAGADSVATKPYIARRCSALFSLISDRYERRRDPGTADMYSNWSIGFEVGAVGTDIQRGGGVDEALRLNEVAIAEVAEVLKVRMNQRALADDRLLSSDLRTCRVLVDELGLQGD